MANKLKFDSAQDIKLLVSNLVVDLKMDWINLDRIFYYRSNHSQARAYARIWGLSRVWQMSLNLKPAYVIEVLSEKFDKLNEDEKCKVLIHELCHIPKNFSGSLLPHTRARGPRNFERKVHELYDQYLDNKKQSNDFRKNLKAISTNKSETQSLLNFLYSRNKK